MEPVTMESTGHQKIDLATQVPALVIDHATEVNHPLAEDPIKAEDLTQAMEDQDIRAETQPDQ